MSSPRALVALTLFIAACGGKDGDSGDNAEFTSVWLMGIECTTCTSPAPLLLSVVEVAAADAEGSGKMKMKDANSYSYDGALEIGEVEIQSKTDATIDWCALTTDLRGRAVVDPASVDQVLLVEFVLGQDEVMAKVEKNELKQNDTQTQWLLLNPGSCTVKLTDFAIIGNGFDPEFYMVENPEHSWLASVMNTPNGRWDILMSTFITPLDSSTNTEVGIGNDSATLQFDANLHDLTPLQTVAGLGSYSLDWSGVAQDVNGHDFDVLQGDRLLVGKVPVGTVEEVEDVFLRVDEEAEKLYYIYVYGTTFADLSEATAEDGSVFEGFTYDVVE